MKGREKILFISLGCPKNLVESEYMLGILDQHGYSFVSDPQEAHTVIINTCGFIREAVEEAIDCIVEYGRMKERGIIERLFVTGCMVQRYGYKLRRELPEVDGWMGTACDPKLIIRLLGSENGSFFIQPPTYPYEDELPRLSASPYFIAYLRISEGCSNRCTFCMIPKIKGPYRSRSIASVLNEAKRLRDRGVRELNIVSQDTTSYGMDLRDGTCIETLLEELIKIEGIEWIRLMYCNPSGISDRLLRLLEEEEKICPYIDVPFQHVNRSVLAGMGRDVSPHPLDIVERIRSLRRYISIRTTLMVGFPGETDNAFEELYEFVKEAEFDHLGVFIYSDEMGTRAYRYEDKIERSIAEHRYALIMELQREISLRKNRERIGKIYPVLIEGYSKDTELLLEGRAPFMAPEIDSKVIINRGYTDYGKIEMVRIVDAFPYDLVGEIVSSESSHV